MSTTPPEKARLVDYQGRVAVRVTGNFNIQTINGLIQGVRSRYCTVVQRGDGYGYSLVAKTDVTGALPKAEDVSHPALYLPGTNAGVFHAFR